MMVATAAAAAAVDGLKGISNGTCCKLEGEVGTLSSLRVWMMLGSFGIHGWWLMQRKKKPWDENELRKYA